MLQNNSNEMETYVETFLMEEITELLYDNEKLDLWHELVKDLGLEGQTKIVTKEKSPIPFLWMNTGLINIFKTLLPRSVKLQNFDKTPIPVEILSLCSMAKKECYFQKIEVWYNDQERDPVVVGMSCDYTPVSAGWKMHHDNNFDTMEKCLDWLKKQGITPYNEKGGCETNEKFYLIGKWGDVKHPFSELKEMAIKRYTEEKTNQYQADIKKAQQGIANIAEDCFTRFGGNATITNEYPF